MIDLVEREPEFGIDGDGFEEIESLYCASE
jgi:hypothetical protein